MNTKEFCKVRLATEGFLSFGWFPEQFSNLLSRNWKGVDVETEVEDPEAILRKLIELKLVAGTGHCVSLWVTEEQYEDMAKYFVNFFDKEVVCYRDNVEMIRYDKVCGVIKAKH